MVMKHMIENNYYPDKIWKTEIEGVKIKLEATKKGLKKYLENVPGKKTLYRFNQVKIYSK